MYLLSQLEEVRKAEEELRFSSFDKYDAMDLAGIVADIGRKESLSICCQIVLEGFETVRFFLGSTDESNIKWLTRKKNTVYASHGWSSLRCGMECELNGITELWHNDVENYVIRGGGFPILGKSGELFGVLCISGLPHTEDHNLCVLSLQAFINRKDQ